MPGEEWTYEQSAGRPVAHGTLDGYALYVIDHQRSETPVRWYVRRVGMFFYRAQGEACTLAEGQRAAAAAAGMLISEEARTR